MQMLQGHTTVPLRTPCTSENCVSDLKPDGNMYSYAFVSVNNKEDGGTFSTQIGKVEVDGLALEAQWSTRSRPKMTGTPNQILNKDSGATEKWHPLAGQEVQGCKDL